MKVKIICEDGYDAALFGLGLSHGVTSGMEFTPFNGIVDGCNDIFPDEYYRMEGVAQKLAGKGNGHDKFLRQIMCWIDITAPRYWWQEMDQYKIATVTQSESTMHTIHKRPLVKEDFEQTSIGWSGESLRMIEFLNSWRDSYLEEKDKFSWKMIIQHLPQSYLQRRIWTGNYAILRAIIEQRRGHKLSEWAVFIDAIKNQCQHPELLP